MKFYSALAQLKVVHGITMDNNEFEELGMIAWEKINRRDMKTYRVMKVAKDYKIDTPCNLIEIEVLSLQADGTFANFRNVSELEIMRDFKKIENISSLGKMVDYELCDNHIKIKETDVTVYLVYRGLVLDEDGLPFIDTKISNAIAYYCAYIYHYKKFLQRQSDANTMMFLKQQWEVSCLDARMPEELNQNKMDMILEYNSSWDRKLYNRSFYVGKR